MPARDSLQTRCYFICGEKKAANLSSGSAAVKRSEQSREYWTQFLLKVKKKIFPSFPFSAVNCLQSA